MPDTSTINVYFIILPNTLALDLAGPAEVLRVANQVLQRQQRAACFTLHFASPAEEARLSTGMVLHQLEALPSPEALPPHAWLVIMGQNQSSLKDSLNRADQQTLIAWLRRLDLQKQHRHIEIIAICAGSLFLAQSGLLSTYKATTHHHSIETLKQLEPRCEVRHDCIFVEDRQISSSAGVSTGIDLMIHKVARICGEIVAAEVAQWLVIPYRRPATATQISPLLAARSHLHPALHKVQQAINDHPQQRWTVSRMAKQAHLSTRHLTRLFWRYSMMSPLQYLMQTRIAIAKNALVTGTSVTRAAEIAGFQSDSQLRRAWRNTQQPGTPSHYAATAVNHLIVSHNWLPQNGNSRTNQQ